MDIPVINVCSNVQHAAPLTRAQMKQHHGQNHQDTYHDFFLVCLLLPGFERLVVLTGNW